MKDAQDLLAELRAAGVEPLSDDKIKAVIASVADGARERGYFEVRMAANLLEARATLAEVREWAESYANAPADALCAFCGRELLEILDRELTS